MRSLRALARSRDVSDAPSDVSITPSGSVAPTAVAVETSIQVAGEGLGEGWLDYGWSADVTAGEQVQLDLGNYGGWIVAHPDLNGIFSAVSLTV